MPAGTYLNASVGSYRLVDFLGAGGMGEVYRGIDTRLGRVVAIKVLSTSGQGGTLLERFKNEARIQSTLRHPNVVTLFDFLELGGQPCIVMEYVDGETIDGRIRRCGPIDAALALELFAAIAEAVGYLHDRGIIHRDLKASNIKLTDTNQVKLLDFGLARAGSSPKLTATGHVVGTLEYMAPEQLAQQSADQRTDIWSLGVLLYEMVTGRMPFATTSAGDLIRRIATAEFPPASSVQPGLPRPIDALIAACLRQDPDDRVQSVSRLLGMVRTLLARLRRDQIVSGPVLTLTDRKPATWRGWVLAVFGSQQAVLVAVVVGAFGLLATIGLAVTNAAGRDHASDTDTTVVAAPPGPPALAHCGLAPGGTDPDTRRTVTIDVAGGWAEVRCGTEVIGRTPFAVAATIGVPVVLRLTRAGFDDEPVEFTPTSNTTGVQFTMTPSTTDESPEGPDPSRGWALVASWSLPWFGRRRRAPAPAVKATNTDLAALGGPAEISVNLLSDIGCVRDTNEDAIGACRPEDPAERDRAGVLLVVADGMGGHSAGEVASRLAVETLIDHYALDNGDPQAALVKAVRLANQNIRTAARADATRVGMGTTCTALVVRQGWAYCAHVGDSRLYLIRDGNALQMTEDHSAVYDLVKRGVIDREDARAHPDRNVIVRALGSRADLEVSAWAQPLFVRSGDRFLVSSDGLHDLVSDDEIAATATLMPAEACRALIEAARGRGGHDNISVGILTVTHQLNGLSAGPSGPREAA